MLGRIRAFSALGLAALVTPPMVLVQIVILKTGLGRPALLPMLWHRFVLKLLGFRLTVHGEMAKVRPLLIAANHISWTDIMVAGSLGEVAFVAKSEVASWPAIGPLAKLSRTVFVERDRKARAGTQAGELAGRLSAREAMVLFAEGSTADGNMLLPFKSSLFGAVQMAQGEPAFVQPVTIAYTRLHGMPMGRQHRIHASWIGDRVLLPHIMALLSEGGVDVEVHFHEPIAAGSGQSRKALASQAERVIADQLARTLRSR